MQNHRMGKAGRDHWRSSSQSNLPAQADFPGVYNSGLCPDGFWLSPEKESLQSLWETCSGSQSPSQQRSSSSHSGGTHSIFLPIAYHPKTETEIENWQRWSFFLNSVNDGVWPFLVGGEIFLVNSNRTKDGKVDENQGKASGVSLRRENQGLELQNFSRERKPNISHPIYRFITISNTKKVELWKWEKLSATFSSSIHQRDIVLGYSLQFGEQMMKCKGLMDSFSDYDLKLESASKRENKYIFYLNRYNSCTI